MFLGARERFEYVRYVVNEVGVAAERDWRGDLLCGVFFGATVRVL